MSVILSKPTSVVYKYLVKPILFLQSPDKVHTRLLKLGSVVQKSRLLMGLTSAAWARHNDAVLSQKIKGVTFHNPVGLSAGFDKNFDLPILLKSVGFGYMEGGSLTYEHCDGNPRPWFHRLPKTKALAVHAGLANDGVDAQIKKIGAYPENTFEDFPLLISVAKTNSKKASTDKQAIADYTGSLKKLKQTDLGDMYVINISCPNTYGGEPFTTPKRLEALLSAVDKVKMNKPVMIKMPIDLSEKKFQELVKLAYKHNIEGLIIGNLAKDRSKMELKDPLPDKVKGGISGTPTWELSNQHIKTTYKRYGDRFFIIGVGGVMSAKQAYAKIKLGASTVSLITGMIYEGPQLIGQINRGLEKLLKADGYNHISEAVGADVK